MRQDFDFVMMGDYVHDMRESGERAAHIIRELRKDRDFWRALFWQAVKQTGPLCIDIACSTQAPASDLSGSLKPGEQVEYLPDPMLHRFSVTPTPPS